MRVFAARSRPVLIYTAIIVGHQKRTRGLFKNKILIFVQTEVPADELSGFHFPTFGQSFRVFIFNDRAD